MGKIREFLHNNRMRRNTIILKIEVLEDDKRLMEEDIKELKQKLEELEKENVRNSRRNTLGNENKRKKTKKQS